MGMGEIDREEKEEGKNRVEQVAQRHQEVGGPLALP